MGGWGRGTLRETLKQVEADKSKHPWMPPVCRVPLRTPDSFSPPLQPTRPFTHLSIIHICKMELITSLPSEGYV